MKNITLLLIVFGAAFSSKAQTTIVDSLFYTGVWHHYRVYVPASHTCSLIIHLHGYGSNTAIEQSFTNYMPVADTAGFIVAYPDGLKDSSGKEYWNIGWSFPNTDDIGYLSVFIDTLVKRYSIDPKNVFASGLSVGGFMCHKLACELSNKIAAIADISGSITTQQFSSCTPARAVPVMIIHGTADNIVAYTGSSSLTTPYVDIDTLIKFCANIDQCNPLPNHTRLAHDTNTTDGSTVDHYVYTGGLQGATCELYKINGGGHIDWPGNGFGNNDFNASQAIWNFFNSYHPADCSLPAATINNISIMEGNSGFTKATFKVILSAASAQQIKISYATKNGSALAGPDYTAKSGKITFQPGQVSKNIAVDVIGDTIKEKNEKFYLMLSNPVNTVLTNKDSAICTIKNDDIKPLNFSNEQAVDQTNNYQVYPNPANKIICLILGKPANSNTYIVVYSTEGKAIMQQKISQGLITQQFSISNLPAGNYVAAILENGKEVHGEPRIVVR